MRQIAIEIDEHGIANVSVFDETDQPSTITQRLIAELASALRKAHKDNSSIIGAYITSTCTDFLGAGDHGDSLRNLDATPNETSIKDVKSTLREIEMIGIPVVIGISGPALDTAFEIALACSYRIALDAPSVKVGLTGVNMGAMPIAGGITRLVHTIGLQSAIATINQGTAIVAQKALKSGLIDAISSSPEDMKSLAVEWIKNNVNFKKPWDTTVHKIPGGTPADFPPPEDVMGMLDLGPAMVLSATKGVYPVPMAVFSCARDVSMVNFDAAQIIENRYLMSVMQSSASKSMRKAFSIDLAEIQSGELLTSAPAIEISKIGVVGAGLLGNSIAVLAAVNGYSVVVKSSSPSGLEKGTLERKKIINSYRRLTQEEKDAIESKIQATDQWQAISECHAVIESVIESYQVKMDVFEKICSVVSDTAMIATNTSSLSVGELAKSVTNPSRFVGMHFFTPAHKMPLIEVVYHQETAQNYLSTAADLSRKFGKTPVIVVDSPGFYTTRVISTFVSEAARMVREGVDPVRIDNAALMNGSPMGPLAVLDEIGIDTAARNAIQMRADVEKRGLPDKDVDIYELVSLVIESGERTGRAAMAGIYDYHQDGSKRPWHVLKSQYAPTGYVAMDFQDIRDRLLFIQSIESTKCIQEGTIGSAAEANIGSIMGIGFPAHTGGALQFIESYGRDKFIQRANDLAKKYGHRFSMPT